MLSPAKLTSTGDSNNLASWLLSSGSGKVLFAMRAPLISILLLGASPVAAFPAVQLLFDDGLHHLVGADNSDPGDGVIVEDSDVGDPTSVTIGDGADLGAHAGFAGLVAFGQSEVTIIGGNFNGDAPAAFYDQSHGTLSGGVVGDPGSVVTFSASDRAVVDVRGGTFRGGGILAGAGSPTVNIYGGDFSQLGRAIAAFGSGSEGTPVVNVFGTGFNYPPGAIPDETGTLTGFLSDGSPFDNTFFRSEAVINIVVVPEPSAAALFLASILIVLRRHRHR